MDSSAPFDISEFPHITQIRLKSFTGELGGKIRINCSGITPKQQKGPTCGLVALSMCLEHFGVVVDVETILEKAREMGFTKQGEMYSAEFLASLINEFLPNSASASNFPDAKTFSQSIFDGNLLLIAYDCGPNYQPVYKNGNSAHWLLAVSLAPA
uniref:Actin maturation protease n=1 Tax=Caenorhabditis japonica TaxID=281687 RepID=A0A8R1I0T6_CAEJA